MEAYFFYLQPTRATLSDINDELINCYAQVRDNPEQLIRTIARFSNASEIYYRVRNSKPRTPLSRAARFLYLARLSFNGIHRVNLAGHFNVPYGGKTHLESVDADAIREASNVLYGVDLLVRDFELATSMARHGDLVYFDPPYTVAHSQNGFITYNEHIFSWADQERLARHALRLANRGCRVIVSNADHPSIRALYSSFCHETIERFSVIAATKQHRRLITESVFFQG